MWLFLATQRPVLADTSKILFQTAFWNKFNRIRYILEQSLHIYFHFITWISILRQKIAEKCTFGAIFLLFWQKKFLTDQGTHYHILWSFQSDDINKKIKLMLWEWTKIDQKLAKNRLGSRYDARKNLRAHKQFFPKIFLKKNFLNLVLLSKTNLTSHWRHF